MSKVKIFATIVLDELHNISLNPKVFDAENNIFYQEIEPDTEMTQYNNWKPWNGYYIEYGFIDTTDNKYYQEYDEFLETLESTEYETFMSHSYSVEKVDIYKEGVLVETKYNKI